MRDTVCATGEILCETFFTAAEERLQTEREKKDWICGEQSASVHMEHFFLLWPSIRLSIAATAVFGGIRAPSLSISLASASQNGISISIDNRRDWNWREYFWSNPHAQFAAYTLKNKIKFGWQVHESTYTGQAYTDAATRSWKRANISLVPTVLFLSI